MEDNYKAVVRSGIVTIPADKKHTVMKRCPFCGSPAEMCETIMGAYVRCTNRDCGTMQTECDYKAEALEAWNRRGGKSDWNDAVKRINAYEATHNGGAK